MYTANHQLQRHNSNQIIWFVDDTNVYRVTIHKTFEGAFLPLHRLMSVCVLLADKSVRRVGYQNPIHQPTDSLTPPAPTQTPQAT
jgi:hypothetical protein